MLSVKYTGKNKEIGQGEIIILEVPERLMEKINFRGG